MTASQAERLARLETIAQQQSEEIHKLTEISEEMVKFVAAQQALNVQAKRAHDDQREDRWQVWLRWAGQPGISIAAIVALLWKVMSGG
jgi:hypothetical protein